MLQVLRFPDRRGTIILLGNLQSLPGRIVQDIVSIVVGGLRHAVPRHIIGYDPAVHGRFSSMYRAEDGDSLEVFFDGVLLVRWQGHFTAGMFPESDRDFYLPLTQGMAGFREREGGIELVIQDANGEVQIAFGLAVQPSAQLSIGRPITLNLSHVYQRLSFDGTHILTANLFQVRGFYHFSTRVFVRAIVQFQDVERNPAAYTFAVDSEQRTLFTQLLFSYKLNPQTVAFVGYSDNRLGTETVDLTQTGRTFFVKLGYALRP